MFTFIPSTNTLLNTPLCYGPGSMQQRSEQKKISLKAFSYQPFSVICCSQYPNEIPIVQFTQSCPTLCDPMDCSTPGFPVHHQLPELAQTHVHQVSDVIQPLILCRPLLLLPSIFPSIRVFSNESVLCIRWPKYWAFSFSISLLLNTQGSFSFRIDWFDLHAVQGTLKSLIYRVK